MELGRRMSDNVHYSITTKTCSTQITNLGQCIKPELSCFPRPVCSLLEDFLEGSWCVTFPGTGERMKLHMVLLLGLQTHLASALNPSDPNVCSYWESFTTATKESYAHPYAQVSKESCDGTWNFFKPCTQQKIMYKTAYRQAVKIDYRKRYRCCQGYYESTDICVPRCTKECVHGRCVAPDQCQCEQGWRGADCSSECDARFWGPRCKQPCQCGDGGTCDPRHYLLHPMPTGGHNSGSCDPVSGRCHCAPGYTGERLQHSHSCHPMSGECTCQPGWAGLHCNETCPQGYYGANCQEPCLCLNGGTCDGTTGRCRCAPGYTGEHCSSYCPANTYGVNCSLTCTCKNAFACSPIDGTCVCKEGSRCNLVCADGSWGQRCSQPCACKNGATCSPEDGSCSCAPGARGPACQRPCQPGRYGKKCAMSCRCANHSTCHHVNGSCDCFPGWTGSDCSQPCPPGTWGLNGGRCSTVDGTCSCPAGFTGRDCLEGCPMGSYGENCAQTCRCQNEAQCDPASGRCLCPPGYTSAHCEAKCPTGTFGPSCLQVCECLHNATCHHTTGRCQCEPGRSGARCETWNAEHPFTMVPAMPMGYSSLGAIIGVIVLVILLVVLLVLFVGYRHWQKGKENRHLAVAYTSGRTDSSEYAVPDVPPSYTHYYSNPSYHTLSRCTPASPARSSQDRASSLKVSPSPSRDTAPGKFPAFHSPEPWGWAEERHPSSPSPGGRVVFEPIGECVWISEDFEEGSPTLLPAWKGHSRMQGSSRTHGPTLRFPKHWRPATSCSPTSRTWRANATLPADWKHHGVPVLKSRQLGGSHMGRSCSCSNSLGKYYSNDYIKEEALRASNSSLNSENPYATIKDLPLLMAKPSEGSYMEMKSPVKREMSYAEIGIFEEPAEALRASNSSLNSENPYATIKDLPLLMAKPSEGSYMEMKSPVKREMSYAEIGIFEEPAAGSEAEESCPPGAEGVSPTASSVPPNHYDSPKNSHIPSHYDMPPVRHYPPSPPLRRQAR
nr:LOW QUALITY PROTEIN: platelet endothelial aggregation receptor 1 [Pelodiscus sinensis]|eukprot:XP_025035923.1 LOW QUALITY PROTEIN: platelet endothelial aggregation receptor 1 [Pelodiscus sinensis]